MVGNKEDKERLPVSVTRRTPAAFRQPFGEEAAAVVWLSLLLGLCSWWLLSQRQPSQLCVCRVPQSTGPAGDLRKVAPLDTGKDRFLLCLAVRKKEFQLSCSQVLRTVCVCVCVCDYKLNLSIPSSSPHSITPCSTQLASRSPLKRNSCLMP